MAASSRRTPEPPAFELGDAGVRWKTAPGRVDVRRRLSVRALVPSVLMMAMTIIMAVVAWRDSPLLGLFFAFATIFPAAFVFVRLVHRAGMTITADGITWRQERPRPFHGQWERRRIEALRVRVHPRPTRGIERRQASVDARVDGAWCILMFGGPVRRAERFADDVALVLGIASQRHDESPDADEDQGSQRTGTPSA